MKKKMTFMPLLAVLSTYFLQSAPNAISPALETIFSVFGEQYPITVLLLISTLPSLLSLPSTLFFGAVAGKKVRYKTLAVIGTVLFLIGGLAPAFTSNYILILVERGVFGIAVGLIAPLGASLVQSAYEGDKRAKVLGLGTLALNLGGILFTMIAGYLANFGWNYTFFVYGIAIISLILVILFLPEPQIKEPEETSVKEKSKASIPKGVWITCILFGILFMLNYTMMISTSTLLAERELGNSTMAAIVLSLFTVGGMIAGALFGALNKILKRFLFSISLFIGAIGFALLVFGTNITMIILGEILAGFSMFTIMSGSFVIIGMTAPPSLFALSNSILMASMSIFSFLATYWIGIVANITGDATTQPIFFAMIIMAVFAVIFLIVNPLPKSDPKSTE